MAHAEQLETNYNVLAILQFFQFLNICISYTTNELKILLIQLQLQN